MFSNNIKLQLLKLEQNSAKIHSLRIISGSNAKYYCTKSIKMKLNYIRPQQINLKLTDHLRKYLNNRNIIFTPNIQHEFPSKIPPPRGVNKSANPQCQFK